MNTLLLIEDSPTYALSVSEQLIASMEIKIHTAANLAETRELLDTESINFDIALIDYLLPDSSEGEAIDLVLQHRIPVIVMTGHPTNEVQEMIWSRKVIDYVVKEGPHSLEYIVATVNRILRNKNIDVIIVDDSPTARRHLRDLLELQQFRVHEADTGKKAMETIYTVQNLKLVLLDYKLPDTDGLNLLRQIRRTFPMNAVAILALSSEGQHQLSVQFIKNGANDFLSKPFLSEQLYTRINLNLNMVEQFQMMKELAITDPLTGLHNRRYFFDLAPKVLSSSIRAKAPALVAMLDIDHFKHVNDTHGHAAGDTVLKTLGNLLKKSFRESDIIARYGGEEFCILATNIHHNEGFLAFERLRKKVEALNFRTQDTTFKITISIGLCTEPSDNIQNMIRIADDKLYASKNNGRNMVTA